MRVVDDTEGQTWLMEREWTSLDGDYISRRLTFNRVYAIPADAGRQTALGREIASAISALGSECVLWISGYGVWPSSENPELFAAYRRSLGEHRSLHEASMHLLTPGDQGILECLLDLVLYFSWDAVALVPLASAVIALSHDEHLTLYAETTDRLQRVHERLGSVVE